jgi:hypothetical protein
MGAGHYYFDKMKSSFNLVQNQLFGAQETQYLQTTCLNLSNGTTAAVQKKGT